MADNNEMLIQILQTLNDFQLQTAASFSEVRAEIKKSREIENEHWQENLRRWDENDKRWDKNDKRWDENDKRWDENDKRWEENNRRWDENDKRWDENDRRWAENDKRWEENYKNWDENKKLWEENKKLWKENEINRKNDKNDILNILINYDISISTQLKDKNVSKMKRFLKA